jgi:dTMP kinase
VANTGRFVTFEGGEGAGKSTQTQLLADALRRAGIGVLVTREPGGSPGAEAIRALVLEGEPGRWDAETEALLMAAARRDHVTQAIRPALESGQWVVCDRFADSTLAYQGYGRGVSLERLRELHRFACDGLHPHLTLILDLPAQAGLKRATTHTRFERMGPAFHERIRQGFLEIAKLAPERCVVIDAAGPAAEVAHTINATVRERLKIAL